MADYSIMVIDRDGKHHDVEATVGWTIMELIRDAGLEIEAACGGSLACATCHVLVDTDWTDRLDPISEEENDMLDLALDYEAGRSRLSCQITFGPELDGLTVTLAD
jgi:2Fe-2S ferredoxin